jgi:hypothetical protein
MKMENNPADQNFKAIFKKERYRYVHLQQNSPKALNK